MGTNTAQESEELLLKKDKDLLWHPFTPLVGSEENLVVSEARGACLYTPGGREIIDAISSWWVNLHGHSNAHIADSLAKQARKLEHVMFAGFTHEPAIRLAENLLSILPKNQSKVFLSDNGSTAVEVALKMALQFWHNQGVSRKKIIALEGGYHGDTFGAMSVGERGAFTEPFWPYLFEVCFIDLPGGQPSQNIDEFTSLVEQGEVAAFIYEPVIQGAAGMRTYSISWLEQLLDIAQRNGVLCIADEVMTGFGRTGKMFASEFMNRQPDIICLSKGLTGGALALGATTCTEEVQRAFKDQDIYKTFFHGHSYTGNPLACAAANASFELLTHKSCGQAINRISSRFAQFKQLVESDNKVKTVTHLGTILAIEFNSESETSYVNEARHQLYPYFLSRGVLLRPLGNIIYLIPPYVINDQQLDKVFQVILEYLREGS